MPNIKQNIGVLRNGVQKRRSRTENPGHVEEVLPQRLPTRDHWDRLETFKKRQFPKRRQDHFIPPDMMKQADAADRDTPLGIMDTVARELITHWMPEIELFLADDAYDDDDLECQAYKKLVDGLNENVVLIVGRVDVGEDITAKTLAAGLQDCAQMYLTDLYEACADVLSDKEEHKYNSNKEESTSKHKEPAFKEERSSPTGILTEARILDSTIAWSLIEFQRPLSPKKRRLSQTRFLDEPDPADNGLVWSSPQVEMKKHKFEIAITNTIKISEIESQVQVAEGAVNAEPLGKEEVTEQVIDVDSDQDEFSDSTQHEQDNVMEKGGELGIPGAFVYSDQGDQAGIKTNSDDGSGNCGTM